MILPDVNVLVYANRVDARDHLRYRSWLEGVVQNGQLYGLSDFVLSAFLRLVTNPRIFQVPTAIDRALDFTKQIREQTNCRVIVPGVRHWQIFTTLCRDTPAVGNLVPDAWLAALAIESGCELITTDRDFKKFPGLRSKHPLD
ncbi:MAG TPA: type II toxin-antitoxin system VapC family toxin [Verrucomicrobiae bacterium]|jgi:hypothetical protein|nr:type II toxin-antitoxin system VapC family toxin [Verrucomicrobiae bacterium]